MSEESTGFDPVEELVEAFLERYRRGERPSLSEYAANHPEHAERIRALFPALMVMEELGSRSGEATGSQAGRAALQAPMPQRLGDYLLIRPLGSGGMGVVYEAIQESLGRHVALKTLPFHHLSDPTRLERFRREARAAARLHHTHIVPVFGVGQHDGLHYYTMQFIQGHGLDAVLDEVKRLRRDPNDAALALAPASHDSSATLAQGLCTGRFRGEEIGRGRSTATGTPQPQSGSALAPTKTSSLGAASGDRSELSDLPEAQYLRSVARIGIDVAEALEYAHGQGILHRDIKPSNLLLDAQGQVWITDFGLAKAQDSDELTRTGDIVGTLRYMAPERFNGWSDARSDVYALGATLYELLLLRPAFDESDRVKLIEQVSHQSPPPLRQLDRRIPRDLETIVLKALAKEPGERYATAGQLAEDLRRFVGGRPILARRSSSIERLWRWSRRNPVVAGAVGAVAAALVAVAVISMVYATKQAWANQEIRRLAGDLGTERDRLTTSLAQSKRLLAIRNLERGLAACETGAIGLGMLWMIESWKSAVDARDPECQHTARANLAAWRPQYPGLKAVLSHTSAVVGAAFSPDSRKVLSASIDGTAQLWDAASGESIGPPLRVGGQLLGVCFSPDGQRVLTCTEGDEARLWDAATGEPLGLRLRLPSELHILATAIQLDGKIVVGGTEVKADNVLRFWDVATGLPIGPTFKHLGHIFPPAFSANRRTILTASADGTARLWDTATGQPIGLPLKRPGGFRWAALSPDGKTILTAGRDQKALLWDAASCQLIGLPMQHESEVRLVAFSPDGKTVLTVCQDHEARLWDAATGQFIGSLEHQGGIRVAAFSPDGNTILTGSHDGTLRLRDAHLGKPVGQILEIPTTELLRDWSPERKVVVTVAQEPNFQRYAQLRDATTGKPIGARLPQPGGSEFPRLSSDGKVLWTIEADQTARLWDATTAVPVGPAFPLPIKVLASGPGTDGRTFWFTGKDNAVRICDGVTGTVRGCTPALRTTTYIVGFSRDCSTFFTGQYNGEVQLWNAATVTPIGKPFLSAGVVCNGGFSPDGKSLLICHEDGSVWLCDLATRRPLIPALRHRGPVGGTFSPDGKTIVTASKDKTARLWDAATGQPIGPILRVPDAVQRVAFIEDGTTLFTDGLVARLFPVPPDLPDALERMAAWVEVITGLRLDTQQGLIQVLDIAAWLERRERLMQLGGPPETGPEQRLDPILFGPDPAARARSFMEREEWDLAEGAFDEAMRARPFNIATVRERGDLYAVRGLWSEAAAYYAKTVEQYPDVAPLHEQLAFARLLAGDLPGYRAACAAMLARFKPIDDSTPASRVAYACTLAALAVTDLPGLIQVSERSTRWVASNERVVGAVLFRAGRLKEALNRFEQAHKVVQPRAWDWLFLAMIHAGQGHTSEARRFIQQADQWIIEADHAPSGAEKEGPRWLDLTEKPTILLLRSEAEAVVLYDPVFPADPFALKVVVGTLLPS